MVYSLISGFDLAINRLQSIATGERFHQNCSPGRHSGVHSHKSAGISRFDFEELLEIVEKIVEEQK